MEDKDSVFVKVYLLSSNERNNPSQKKCDKYVKILLLFSCMSRQTTGPFQPQSPNSVAEHKNAAMIECVYVHLQIYLLLVGEVSD